MSKFATTIFISSLFSLFLVSTPTLAQQKYPLICRSGGRISIRTLADGSGEIQGLKQGRTAVNRNNPNSSLAPGECGWEDRAMNSNEPTTICYSNVAAFNITPITTIIENLNYRGAGVARYLVHNDTSNRCMRVN
ncbi:hypothetical protein AA637_09395 [Cyanobacterium sp. HL-69]|nr:hypothetical protein AA637_09395 [Cyanobacterium sp. HL-69]